MTTVNVIAIVVVIVLSASLIALDFFACSSFLKSYESEVKAGSHDEEITKRLSDERKGKRVLSTICSYAMLFVVAAFLAFGITLRVNNDNLSFGDTTMLVIKTGSMSRWYDESNKSRFGNPQGFDVGDICFFERVREDHEFVVGDVYGYKERDITITHRLIDVLDGGYLFQGDANPTSDYAYYGHLVKRENILYHYGDTKIPALGSFVLYAQSPFGVWSFASVLGITIGHEIVCRKSERIDRDRYATLKCTLKGNDDEE